MIEVAKAEILKTKKIHCPICGFRLCDVKTSEKINYYSHKTSVGIIVKCNKCKSKFNITIY